MSTVWPADPAGATASIVVLLMTLKLFAGIVPNLTAMAPVKLLPVIVTGVPPAAGPEVGFTTLMTGSNWTVADRLSRNPPGESLCGV